MLKNQTYQDFQHIVLGYPPQTGAKDITERYKYGYNLASNLGFDAALFMENDDWYHYTYIETMVNKWNENPGLQIMGHNHTIYYHIGIKKYFKMIHWHRSSAMNTMIRLNMDFEWCADNDPYTDIHLWKHAGLEKQLIFEPMQTICLGIKHNVGLTGGENHCTFMHRYINEDNGFLKNTVDNESFEFYEISGNIHRI
jgi:hypothetical protein